MVTLNIRITLDQWFQPVSIQQYFNPLDNVHDHSCLIIMYICTVCERLCNRLVEPWGVGLVKDSGSPTSGLSPSVCLEVQPERQGKMR